MSKLIKVPRGEAKYLNFGWTDTISAILSTARSEAKFSGTLGKLGRRRHLLLVCPPSVLREEMLREACYDADLHRLASLNHEIDVAELLQGLGQSPFSISIPDADLLDVRQHRFICDLMDAVPTYGNIVISTTGNLPPALLERCYLVANCFENTFQSDTEATRALQYIVMRLKSETGNDLQLGRDAESISAKLKGLCPAALEKLIVNLKYTYFHALTGNEGVDRNDVHTMLIGVLRSK